MFRRRTVINSTSIPGWDGLRYEKVASRVAATETSLLRDYTDHAGTGMCQAFGDLFRDGRPESAAEIEQALMTLWAVVREMRGRSMID